MKIAACSALLAAVLATSVNAHGQMTSPTPRPVSATFLARSGALKNAGKDELQWAPLENLSQRTQADFPAAADFDMMNGCRGMVYEAGGPVTEVSAGGSLPVKWYVQAPHPGYAEFNIVKPKTSGGKISYEKVVTLKRIEDFAKSGGNGGDTVTIPASVTGCGKAGDCALQMYWHSDIAKQTYPTCADIIIKGSGAGTGAGAGAGAADTADSSGSAPAASTTPASSKTPGKTPAKTTKAPATSAPASDEYEEDTGGDADVKTPAPAATKKKCNRRMRA